MIPEILQKSRKKIADICRRYQIRELSLFGSQVRGDFSSASDFDFLVEFQPEAEIGFIELGFIQEELETIIEKPVDLVPKAGLKKLIREQVLEESEIVYAA
jgi:predicted nucleotidyltransferase